MRVTMIAAALTGVLLATSSPAIAADAIATTDGEAPGVKLDVHELKVSNGVVMMKFTLNNGSSQGLDQNMFVDMAQPTKDYHDVSGVYLVDTVNKKKYLVVRDSDNQCLCSRNLSNFAPAGVINLWARFPAPPDSVLKIGIVVPHFIPMDDVPLTR